MLTEQERRILEQIDATEVRRMAMEASRIASHAPPNGRETELARLFARELNRVGLDVELQEVEPSRPNVIAYLRGAGRGRSLLFNGHLDTTVPAVGWTRDPHGGETEGDKLYGHGMSNMKGPDVAIIGAVAALKRSGAKTEGDVIVSFVVGETRGGQGTKYLLDQGIRADFFISGEPTDLQIMTLHAGVCRLRIVVTGRPHHFAMAGKGINAIEKLMKILNALGESATPIPKDGWLKKRIDKPEYEGFPRFNLAAIRGGFTPECLDSALSSTPDCCIAKLDIRYPPGLSPELIQQDLEETIEKLAKCDSDIRAKVELLESQMTPFETSLDDFIVKTFVGAYTEILGQPSRVGAITPLKFRGTDSGLLQAAGLRGVICGVGTVTGSVPDEYVEVSKLVDLSKVFALAAYRVAGRAE